MYTIDLQNIGSVRVNPDHGSLTGVPGRVGSQVSVTDPVPSLSRGFGSVAECRKRLLNQGSFVLLYFVLFVFLVVFNLCIPYIFKLSFLLYFPEHAT